jgi:hypothetical protein
MSGAKPFAMISAGNGSLCGVQLFWGDWRVELIGLNPVQRFVDLLKFMLGFQEPFRIGLLLHPVEQRPLPLKKLCDIGHVDLRSVAPGVSAFPNRACRIMFHQMALCVHANTLGAW